MPSADITFRTATPEDCAVILHHRRGMFRLKQILDDVIAGFVHVRVDAVRRQVPRLPREADADVAADLPYPHRQPAKPQQPTGPGP